MKPKSARVCLYLVLLDLSLGSAVAIGDARHTVTVQAPIVLMQLQAYSEPYENAAAPETGKTSTPELCTARDQYCVSLTQERAMVRHDDRRREDRAQPESRSRTPVEELHPISRN